jgi:hypothetical protein
LQFVLRDKLCLNNYKIMEPNPTNTNSPQPQPAIEQMHQHATNSQVPPVQNQSDAHNPPFQPAIHNNSGTLVMQWLTYALWGWTVFAMSILTTVVLSSVINDSDTASFSSYAIAAVLVLLPIAITVDVFYSKKEPAKKTGGASIVMVIHAVLFALFAVGSLISVVISIVSLFTDSSDNSSKQVWLLSSLIIFLLYTATLLRTINPPKFPFIRRAFIIFMAVTVGIVAIAGIAGPAAKERATRNDRLIESNLGNISDAVEGYASKNNSIPSSLKQLDLNGDAKKLVDDNLVQYLPNSKQASSTLNNYDSSSYNKVTLQTQSTTKIYYYQLCVDYKKEKKDKYSSYSSSNYDDASGYSSYIDTYRHPEGRTCYKLKTNDY